MKNRRTVTRAEAAIEIIQYIDREFTFVEGESAAVFTLAAVFSTGSKPENLIGLIRLITEASCTFDAHTGEIQNV